MLYKQIQILKQNNFKQFRLTLNNFSLTINKAEQLKKQLEKMFNIKLKKKRYKTVFKSAFYNATYYFKYFNKKQFNNLYKLQLYAYYSERDILNNNINLKINALFYNDNKLDTEEVKKVYTLLYNIKKQFNIKNNIHMFVIDITKFNNLKQIKNFYSFIKDRVSISYKITLNTKLERETIISIINNTFKKEILFEEVNYKNAEYLYTVFNRSYKYFFNVKKIQIYFTKNKTDIIFTIFININKKFNNYFFKEFKKNINMFLSINKNKIFYI